MPDYRTLKISPEADAALKRAAVVLSAERMKRATLGETIEHLSSKYLEEKVPDESR